MYQFERGRNFTKLNKFLAQKGISQKFPKAVNAETVILPNEIPEEQLKGREDLTNRVIITIDGETAKDFDDAVSVELLENGNYLLGVHIADVSYYVKEGSALDKEAFDRGTSIYLVDGVIPMLPEKLSNDLCSLQPDKLRLTLSCFMEVCKDGDIANYNISETVIKSSKRMTYTKLDEVLNGDMASRNESVSLLLVLELMRELAMVLRDKRMRRGSMDFDLPEPKVITDKAGNITEITVNPNTAATKIIEEFMIAANETIAMHINKLGLPLVYRVHERPNSEKIQQLAVLVGNMGYKFKKGKQIRPKDMQKVLFEIKDTPQQTIISTMMLRSLAKARYSDENLGHFGLASEYYCHFTAPIRRYPDVIVHRILHEWLQGKLDKKQVARFKKTVKEAATQSSETEIFAVETEREYTGYKLCEYMEGQIGQTFNGYISSVTSFGFFVQLPSTIEGLVGMSNLDDDYYVYDQATLTLTGRHTGNKYVMGQHITVQLIKVSTELRQIDFIPVPKEQKEEKKKNGTKTGRKGKRKYKTGRAKQKGKA
ncbi:MAG: ribonuclease R [Clostridiaceae bacterium]|nr:ribonuclease R [Clostridiaceae bacterium]